MKDLNRGSVILEGTFMYPLVFAVLFFVIFLGDTYYKEAQIQNYTAAASLDGAATMSSPTDVRLIKNSDGTYSYPSYSSGSSVPEVNPFRYIIGAFSSISGCRANDTTNAIASDLNRKIQKASLFGLQGAHDVSVEYCPGIMFGDFRVRVNYNTIVPFYTPFTFANPNMTNTASAITPVSSISEFMRNVDFVEDLILPNANTYAEKATGVLESVNSAIGGVAKFVKLFGIGENC
jgi:hypothetical protein